MTAKPEGHGCHTPFCSAIHRKITLAGGLVGKFFDKLAANLSIAHGPGNAPFYAPRDVEPAHDWKATLLDGLRESEIIVCLQSPWYFESKIVLVFFCEAAGAVALAGNRRLAARRRELSSTVDHSSVPSG